MIGKTERKINGRLFASTDVGPFRISAQAGSEYACSPNENFPFLEDYDSVEVGLFSDRAECIDVSTLGLPPSLARRFPKPGSGRPCIAGHLSLDEVNEIVTALTIAACNPNSGYPRGVHGWAERTVYHGTSAEFATLIVEDGIDMNLCTPGYFGQAFHVAEDENLARANYADMSDDEGDVVSVTIDKGARILDLRNSEDWSAWKKSGLDRLLGTPGFHLLADRQGIDGVYDRSVGGLAIFNSSAVTINDVVNTPSAPKR